jgi:hypothetical protein
MTQQKNEVVATRVGMIKVIQEELTEVTLVLAKAALKSAEDLDLSKSQITRAQVQKLVRDATSNLRWVDAEVGDE